MPGSRGNSLLFWKFLIVLSLAIGAVNLFYVSGIYNILVKDNIANVSFHNNVLPMTISNPNITLTGQFALVYSPILTGVLVTAVVILAFYFMWKKIA